MASAQEVRVGVIIPTYRHPVLLTEAIESALAQQTTFGVAVVIVSDGCPLLETEAVCSAYCSTLQNVFYLRKANKGPSSARNYGIEFILHNWPDIDAIFFLDADNRLRPNALQIAFDALVKAPLQVGWIYTNIDTFGIRWSGNYTFPYSPLIHVAVSNMCDTACLVSRRVFESGVRFDEDPRSGFEDWDFWLQCIAKGFLGQPASFGLEYRKRPESRNEQNLRNVAAIRGHIKARHKSLSTPKNLLNWEHYTNPRYLFGIGQPEEPIFESFSDPGMQGHKIDNSELGEIFWSSYHAPDECWFPAFFVWGSPGARECLAEAKLLHNAFFLMEKCARTHNFAALTLSNSDRSVAIDVSSYSQAASLADKVVMWMCSGKILREIVLDPSDDWVSTLGKEQPAPSIGKVDISTPGAGEARLEGKFALKALFYTIQAFKTSDYFQPEQTRWHWRPQEFPGRDQYYKYVCDYLGVDGLMPRLAKSTIDVGLVLPFATYGGAEKVAFALGRTLVQHGMHVHVFIIGDPHMAVVDEFYSSFTSVNILAEKDFPKWGGPLTVFGQESFGPDSPEVKSSLLTGFLAGLDLVVNCHSAPMNALISSARKLGSKTATYLHLSDTTVFGRLVGHTYLTVPFEHAYDLILTCSESLKRDLHALGLPEEKILPIKNAAGFTPRDGSRERAEKERMRARGRRKLRLLYIGRLDRQKGVDRLFNLVAAFRNEAAPVDIRVIGSSLLDASEDWGDRFSTIGVKIEKPLYESRELEEAYFWSDVLLLPSRWEGAPLVIPECQQTGCIPMAVQVGAVDELIEHAVDGILIPNAGEHQVIMEYRTWIDALAANDSLRRELSEKALRRGEMSTWDHNFGPFLEWMRKEFPAAVPASMAAKSLPTQANRRLRS